MVVVVPPAWSVVVTVNVSVPVAVGVPLIVMLPVPLLGTVRPAITFTTLLTASAMLPVPPLAVIV